MVTKYQRALQSRVQLEYLTEVLEPEFCSDCGSRMFPVNVFDSAILDRYDRNGRRQHLVTFKCPNSRWWHFQLVHSHRIGSVKER